MDFALADSTRVVTLLNSKLIGVLIRFIWRSQATVDFLDIRIGLIMFLSRLSTIYTSLSLLQ